MEEKKLKVNEPHIHHYIPQFILRKFASEDGLINYWNMKKRKIERRSSKSIFMDIDLYRDNEQYPEDPTVVESNFSKFEREIAELIANKIIDKRNVILTKSENEKLRIFLTLSSLREEYRMRQYKYGSFDEMTKNELLKYQPDGDFLKLWKRELEFLTKCRSYKEIEKSDILDFAIKKEFISDYSNYYMSFLDVRGGELLLTDVYPTLEMIPGLIMHSIFPISPNRLLLLNHICFKNEIEKANIKNGYSEAMALSKIKGTLINDPIVTHKTYLSKNSETEYKFFVGKCYEKDLYYINSLLLNEVRRGIIYCNSNKIIKSVESFNERDNTKREYNEFLKELNK